MNIDDLDLSPELREKAEFITKLIKVEGFKLDLKTPESCSSYDELLDYARRHNYKPGWAYYRARQRGFIA